MMGGMDESSRRWPGSVYDHGDEPDPRFSLANERTFLAWIRTGLALLAGAAALDALDLPLPDVLQSLLAALLGLAGLTVAFAAYRGWARTERAMREGDRPAGEPRDGRRPRRRGRRRARPRHQQPGARGRRVSAAPGARPRDAAGAHDPGVAAHRARARRRLADHRPAHPRHARAGRGRPDPPRGRPRRAGSSPWPCARGTSSVATRGRPGSRCWPVAGCRPSWPSSSGCSPSPRSPRPRSVSPDHPPAGAGSAGRL